MSKSYEDYTRPYLKTVTDPHTGETKEVLMSVDEVAAVRRRQQEAADLASAIAKRKAAQIAAKSDRRSELEKRRDQIATYTDELRAKLEFATASEKSDLQQRVNQFSRTLSDLNRQVDAERKEAQWRNDPLIKLMVEDAETLRSYRVMFDALPNDPDIDDKINLMKAIAESKDFSDTRSQYEAYFSLKAELVDLNLEGHKQRTADAEERRLAADRDFANQQLAEKRAEGLASGR